MADCRRETGKPADPCSLRHAFMPYLIIDFEASTGQAENSGSIRAWPSTLVHTAVAVLDT